MGPTVDDLLDEIHGCPWDNRWRKLVASLVVVAIAACSPKKPATKPTERSAIVPVAVVEPTPKNWMWDADERKYISQLVDSLRRIGQQDDHPLLVKFAARVEVLLGQADRGELTKEQLVEAYAEAEAAMTDPVHQRIREQMDDLREVVRRARTQPAPTGSVWGPR